MFHKLSNRKTSHTSITAMQVIATVDGLIELLLYPWVNCDVTRLVVFHYGEPADTVFEYAYKSIDKSSTEGCALELVKSDTTINVTLFAPSVAHRFSLMYEFLKAAGKQPHHKLVAGELYGYSCHVVLGQFDSEEACTAAWDALTFKDRVLHRNVTIKDFRVCAAAPTIAARL